jgi:hypothetical protein
MSRIAAIAAILLIPAAVAPAESPEEVEIQEPAPGGAPLNPADVHMVVRVEYPSSEHLCSDWEIWTVEPEEPVWQALCAEDESAVHIHLATVSSSTPTQGAASSSTTPITRCASVSAMTVKVATKRKNGVAGKNGPSRLNRRARRGKTPICLGGHGPAMR